MECFPLDRNQCFSNHRIGDLRLSKVAQPGFHLQEVPAGRDVLQGHLARKPIGGPVTRRACPERSRGIGNTVPGVEHFLSGLRNQADGGFNLARLLARDIVVDFGENCQGIVL